MPVDKALIRYGDPTAHAPKSGWLRQAPVYGKQGRCEPTLTQMEAGGALP